MNKRKGKTHSGALKLLLAIMAQVNITLVMRLHAISQRVLRITGLQTRIFKMKLDKSIIGLITFHTFEDRAKEISNILV